MLGKERFAGVDIRVRVKGGGHVAQIYGKQTILFSLKVVFLYSYQSRVCDLGCFNHATHFCLPAIRQAISKALVAYYQKCKYLSGTTLITIKTSNYLYGNITCRVISKCML